MVRVVNTMTKLAEIKNNKIEATVDMFIVPNCPARFLEGFSYENPAPGYMNLRDDTIDRIAKLNGVEIHKGEKLIQVWLTSKLELRSENLNDHGFRALSESGEEVHLHFNCHSIPATMLNGKTEGEVFDMKIKCYDKEKNEYELLMHIRCNQSEYRYRRFGNFENVLAELIEC